GARANVHLDEAMEDLRPAADAGFVQFDGASLFPPQGAPGGEARKLAGEEGNWSRRRPGRRRRRGAQGPCAGVRDQCCAFGDASASMGPLFFCASSGSAAGHAARASARALPCCRAAVNDLTPSPIAKLNAEAILLAAPSGSAAPPRVSSCSFERFTACLPPTAASVAATASMAIVRPS